jgi:hypothetical protein
MIKSMCAACLLLLVYSTAPMAADKSDAGKGKASSKSYESAYGEDKQKSKGRPDNPGQHGRENAAAKQNASPGKGSKSDDSWEDTAHGVGGNDDEDGKQRGDRDKDQDKDKDKDKDKQKKKEKNKDKDKEAEDDD